MKTISEKIKGIFSDVEKDDVVRIAKIAGSVLVIAVMCVVCIVSYAVRKDDNNSSVGIMMTMSDIAARKEPFAGNTIEIAAISYDGMKNGSYETEQLAQLEKSEKEIEEILSSRRQERNSLSSKSAINSRKNVVIQIAEYDPDATRPADDPNYERPKTVTVTAPTNGGGGATSSATAYTYADENGTYEYIGDYCLTAYCPCSICCGIYSNMENPTTSTGTRATEGRTIAVDPSVIPYGTEININGKIYVAEDCGGAIKGNRIDVFFNSHEAALQFGRQYNVKVYKVIK